jgi:hypothetical protein
MPPGLGISEPGSIFLVRRQSGPSEIIPGRFLKSGHSQNQIKGRYRITRAMPSLTRRNNPHQETWHVYFGDVHVGTIGERAGVPVDVEQCGRSCGFYPGLNPGQRRAGIAETFEDARVAFEVAWSDLLPDVPVDAFAEWRHDRDWRAER